MVLYCKINRFMLVILGCVMCHYGPDFLTAKAAALYLLMQTQFESGCIFC